MSGASGRSNCASRSQTRVRRVISPRTRRPLPLPLAKRVARASNSEMSEAPRRRRRITGRSTAWQRRSEPSSPLMLSMHRIGKPASSKPTSLLSTSSASRPAAATGQGRPVAIAVARTQPACGPMWGGRPIRAKLHGSVLHAISRETPVAVVPGVRGRNQWPPRVLDAM